MENLHQILDQLLEIFDARAVPYALIGDIAVRAHAIPRNTNDIDIVLMLDNDERRQFFGELLRGGFEVPAAYLRGWVDRVKEMPVAKIKAYLNTRAIDVDLFFVESSFQKTLIERRQRIEEDERVLWIASAEDLILLKLLASRPRDRLDVADVFFICGNLDLAYLRHWANELGVRTELEEAIGEAEME